MAAPPVHFSPKYTGRGRPDDFMRRRMLYGFYSSRWLQHRGRRRSKRLLRRDHPGCHGPTPILPLRNQKLLTPNVGLKNQFSLRAQNSFFIAKGTPKNPTPVDCEPSFFSSPRARNPGKTLSKPEKFQGKPLRPPGFFKNWAKTSAVEKQNFSPPFPP